MLHSKAYTGFGIFPLIWNNKWYLNLPIRLMDNRVNEITSVID